MTTELSEAHKRRYRDEGYCVLERVIPDETVAMLREECDLAVARIHAEMDRAGADTFGISHRGKRYFVAHPSMERERVRSFYFSDLFAGICRGTIGDTAYAFWEQYVVKAAEKGIKFGWHQDSGYEQGSPPHKPYVTCWCTLDDVTEENGTVYLLPYSRAGTREVVAHRKETGTNDLVGYFGNDPGIPVIVPAGSVAVFSSVVFHRSGPNTTPRMRRIYLAQYSPEVVIGRDGKTPFGRSDLFLEAGRRVR